MKMNIYIAVIKYTWCNEARIIIDDRDMTSAHSDSSHVVFYKLLEVREIGVPDLPSNAELNGIEIEGLENQREIIQEEARAKVKRINERIANLICIEHLDTDHDEI